MKRICIIVNALMFGGVEKIVENYYSGFDKSKFHITIVAQDNSDRKCIEHFKSMGFEVKLVAHKRKNLIKNILQMRAIIKYGNYYMVHCNMSYTNFYVLQYAKKYGIKVRINHYHNVFETRGIKRFFLSKCNMLCDKYATHNFYCSDAVKTYLNYSENKPSIVLKNAFDLNKFLYNKNYRDEIRDKYSISNDTVFIGQVGRFTKQKNQIFTLELLKVLKESKYNFTAMLIGSGEDYEMIDRYVKKNYLSNNIIMFNGTSEINKYYSAFDLVLLPSLWEGLGIVALESSLAGNRTVLSDHFPDEVVIDENTIKLRLDINIWKDYILGSFSIPKARSSKLEPYKNAGYDLNYNRELFFRFLNEV